MKRPSPRRLALLAAVLASQLLSACVIVPRPYYRSHGWDNHGYYGGQHGDWGRRGDDRRGGWGDGR